MHRNTKRLAAALLAAALCTAVAVPQAAAEPWTYEVDDVMAGYGVEFYPDVGFDNPSRTADEGQSGTAGAAGVASYSGESGIATFADSTDTDAGYTVTIPSEVDFAEGEMETKLDIKGSVEQYRVLTIGVTSTNEWKLKCGDSTEYTIPYTVAWQGTTEQDANIYTVDTDEASKNFTATVNIKLESTENARVSGEYIDTLTFTLGARPKTYTVIYHANDGTAIDNTKQSVFTYGSPAVLEKNTFVNTGFHFAGWTQSKAACTSHTEITYADGATASMANLTLTKAENELDYKTDLYAQWGYLYKVEVDRETVNETFGSDKAVEHSIVLMPGESYSWDRPDDYGWENESRTDKNGKTVLAWEPLTTRIDDISADTTQNYEVKRKRYYIDMNGMCSGVALNGNLGTIAKAQVYVNGVLASKGENGWVNDFFVQYPWGSTYYVIVRIEDDDYELKSIEYSKAPVTVDGKQCGKLTGTTLIGESEANASTVMVTFKKSTSSTQDSTETALLPSWDETSPVVVDVPTVDTPADADSAPADDTAKADTPDPAEEAPETTPADMMLWDAADILLPPDDMDDWT